MSSRTPAVLVAALLAPAVLPSSAGAQRAEITQELLTSAGLPALVANPVPDGRLGRVLGFELCPPGGACSPVGRAGDDTYESATDVPVGSVFRARARATRSGRVTTAVSRPWQGRVTAATPAGLVGAARVGALVAPTAAGWAGGWGTESDVLGVEACPATAAVGCVTLGREMEDAPVCRRGRAVIAPRYEGWYLRATDERFAEDTAVAGVGHLEPEGIPVEPEVPIVSRSAFVGPIAAKRGPFAECGRPHAATIARPLRQRDLQVLGTVSCVSGCEVELVVHDGRRVIRRAVRPTTTRPLTRYGGSYSDAVGLPLSLELRSRRVRVRIRVNGRTRARGTVRLPTVEAPVASRRGA